MTNVGADINLLFGVLALQVDFIDRDQLIDGMQAWAFDKSRSLGQILVDQGALEPHQSSAVEQLVVAHLGAHQQNVQQSLTEATAAYDVPEALHQIKDGQIAKTLSHIESGSRSSAGSSSPTKVDSRNGDTHFGQSSDDSGRFERLQFHDEGGLGRVWLAKDKELDRKVAIKEMKERFADDESSRKRFVMEAEITGGLEHPGVVPVYGYGKYSDGRPFYAMRFIGGGSLRDAIEEFHEKEWSKGTDGEQAVELRRLLTRFLDVCNTIYYAHRRGILHRDIKPSNVMLGDYGETLVVDWGLAKTMGHSTGAIESSLPAESTLMPRSGSSVIATIMGRAIGSPPYMSPEQARGEQDRLGPETDIYSLGATLYTVLTNKRPVDGNTTEDVLRRVRVGEWPSPREIKPDVPRPLEAICLKAMQLNPDERYSSVRRMVRDIEHFLADEPVAACQESIGERLTRFGRRHRPFLIAGAAALLIASLVSTWAAFTVDVKRKEAQTLAASNEALAKKESDARGDAEQREQEAKLAKLEADRARARSDRVRSSLVEILRSPDPERDGRDVTVVEMLDKEVARISDSFADDPMVRSEMLRVIGETYLSLGLQSRAIELAVQAEELTRDAEPTDRMYALNARSFLATAQVRNGKFKQALPLCIEVFKERVQHHGKESEEALQAKQLLAEARLGVGETSKAILLLEDVFTQQRARLGASDRRTMEAASSLATAYNEAKRFDDAIKVSEEAHGIQLEYLGSDDPLTLQTETVLANAYSFSGRLDDSIALHQRALAAKTEKLGHAHVATLESELALALAFITAGRADEAKPHVEHLMRIVSQERSRLGKGNALVAKINFLGGLAQMDMLGMLEGTELVQTLTSVYTSTSYLESALQTGFALPNTSMKTLGALTSGGKALQRLFMESADEERQAAESD